MELGFKIKESSLLSGSILSATSGNMNVHFCLFDIAENNDLDWFCVFKKDDAVYQQVIEKGRCGIPYEVLETCGKVQIGCYATGNGKRISTNWLELDVSEGAYCQATAPKEPMPDVWETLVNSLVPYIGENGNWFIYDREQKAYKDSGVYSKGEKGDKGDAPVLGVDYWTPDDKAEIIEAVENDLNFEERLAKVMGTGGNALKNTVCDTVCGMNDISPLEHILKVTLKAEDTVDLSDVKVKKLGRNLLNYPQISKGEIDEDGIISIKNEAETALYVSTPFISLPKGSYTFLVETVKVSGQYGVFVQLGSATDWAHVVPNINATGKKTLRFTLDKATNVRILNELRANTSIRFKVQINAGEQQEFELYKTPTEYAVSADGSVTGILSDSPSATLFTETDGVKLECEYNRDIGKAIEELKNAIISLGGNV